MGYTVVEVVIPSAPVGWLRLGCLSTSSDRPLSRLLKWNANAPLSQSIA